ncbi:putative peptidase m20 [Rosellinia necatrix]|uniref:Peptidase M20 domain-containing protein 2 n=1 Tax=Rosellinia necatrix TaxID=77044 RepID=A0A1S7UIG9_ROSNE|nr:putative peptidase m20 [Rosellinia necatrix]
MDRLDEGSVFVEYEDAIDIRSGETGRLGEISDFIDAIATELWEVNKTIHDNPELGYEEFIAHETLTTFLSSRDGWKVTPSAYGLATAWVAVFDSGRKGPVVSFNVEMDALEGIGHACGHNLIATASVAGGLAVAERLRQGEVGGRVVLFGTPAEEGGGGKIRLLEAGAYRDHQVDINLLSHPGITKNHALMRTSAYTAFRAEYVGREAHAAANPWLGINALDALITAYNALSVLRQQTMPGDVIQGNITDGGVRPNIIHAYAAGNFVVRADTQARLRELKTKVDACFAAGAVATGATLTMSPVQSYADHVPNRPLGDRYRRHFNRLSSPPDLIPDNPGVDEIEGRTMASTDQGNISYAMPSLNVGFSIPAGPGGAGPHNPGFAEAAGTKIAFENCLRVGKAMAAVAVDVLADPDLLDKVKKEWEQDIRQSMASSRSD